MNDDRKVSIVFTGLITDPDLFARSLDQFTSIKQVNEIILATWDKEASEKKSILSEYAHRYGLIVVAVPEPVEWSGNLLSQMLSLYIGLRQSNKNNYVLKTRTDVFIEKEPLTNVFEKDLTLALPTNYQRIRSPFDEKICVWGIELTSPFYIHDLFYFGRHADIARLVNMDIRYDILYEMSKEKIHIRRFIHPFIHEFPIFEKFLHVEHVIGNTQEFPNEYRYYVLEELLKDEVYILILALYYQVVGHYYTNEWGQKDVFSWRDVPDQVEFYPGKTFSDLLLGNSKLKALLLRGDTLFKMIKERSYGSCPIGKRFDAAFNYIDDLEDIRKVGQEYNFDEFIERVLNIGSSALAKVKRDFS
jgi:hypothetical protein